MALPLPPTQASSGVNACDTTRIGCVTPNATLMRVCGRSTGASNRMALTSMYAYLLPIDVLLHPADQRERTERKEYEACPPAFDGKCRCDWTRSNRRQESTAGGNKPCRPIY